MRITNGGYYMYDSYKEFMKSMMKQSSPRDYGERLNKRFSKKHKSKKRKLR